MMSGFISKCGETAEFDEGGITTLRKIYSKVILSVLKLDKFI